MDSSTTMNMLSAADQELAMQSFDDLHLLLQQIDAKQTETEIEIGRSKKKVTLPLSALKALRDVLHAMSLGQTITISTETTEIGTQKAAQLLGCSRPHFVKLLEAQEMPYRKVGKHRRVKLDDVLKYKANLKKEQKQHIIDMMNADEEAGLYDF
jgi:excisionase family DNA binding protein